MQKQIILSICSFIIVGIVIMISLYASSPMSIKLYRNTFSRVINEKPDLVKINEIDIEYNSFYLAGESNGKIFLGNHTAPIHVLQSDLNLQDTSHLRIEIKIDSIRDPSNLKLMISGKSFYLMHGTMPIILKGNIGEWTALKFIPDSAYYFSDITPMGDQNFALRTYDAKINSYILAKLNSKDASMNYKYDLIKKQIDGMFCVDGRLLYCDSLREIVYTYHYKNEITVADSNMDLKYRGKTIDTFKTPHIKVIKTKKGTQSSLSSPPFLVNGITKISAKYLFVQSILLSQNEDIKKFKSSTVIDIYDLSNKGTYARSIYVPRLDNQRLNDFIVTEKCRYLIALYGQKMVSYEISPEVFKHY